MPKRMSKLIVAVALIALGWVLGQYIENIAFFTYSYEISLIDVISLIVTAFMAWYVSRILEKNIQDKRTEKDLILSKIDEVDQAINSLILLNSSESTVSYVKVVHILTKSRKWSVRFWNIIDQKYKGLSNKEKDNYTSMLNKMREANVLCTYTPPTGVDENILIVGGEITYSNARKYEIDIKLESIRDDLIDFVMKKIMFNDKYGLTQAVLDGRKTMTRRAFYIPDKLAMEYFIDTDKLVICETQYNGDVIEWRDNNDNVRMTFRPKYEVGEVVAIAQSYKDSGYDSNSLDRHPKDLSIRGLMNDSAGWKNKMFVKSYACKHHIKIINVKVERLQDISDEDCIKEGVYRLDSANGSGGITYSFAGASDKKHIGLYDTPREAFAALINKVSGRGTWERNPFVRVYEFKLFD